jgi:hypothetical protein
MARAMRAMRAARAMRARAMRRPSRKLGRRQRLPGSPLTSSVGVQDGRDRQAVLRVVLAAAEIVTEIRQAAIAAAEIVFANRRKSSTAAEILS